MSNSFDFQIFHSVSEVDPVSWDQLSAGRPFTSHQWYRYGETVMADCLPTYVIVYDAGQPIARATFWRMGNDPPAIQSAIVRRVIQAIFKRWPLLICRSPLSGMSGLVLPEAPLRAKVQSALGVRASELLKQASGSFLLFDYLEQKDCADWPDQFASVAISDPGTIMKLTWPSFEAYLEAGNKKDRQHYKKTLREAEKLGIQIQRHPQAQRPDEALALIRGVEHRFGSAENPWAQAMLNHAGMAQGSTFLTATIDNQLVGCGLILQDNNVQMNAILGLAENVSYVYFMLMYESLKLAFEQHIGWVRLGSGAYEVKKQLGFGLEENNNTVFFTHNFLLQKLARLAA